MGQIEKFKGLSLTTMDSMKEFAQTARMAGILGHCRSKEDAQKAMGQAVVKIQYGSEFGLGPMQAIENIHVVQGKPSMGAALMASLVKGSGRYNYRVMKHTDKECCIEFFEEGRPCGQSSFSIKEAQEAGLLKNPIWKSYPKNMLFARAMSNGAKWYCADVFNGAVYTPEELGEMSTAPEPVPEQPVKMLEVIEENAPAEEEPPEPGSFEPEGDLNEDGEFI